MKKFLFVALLLLLVAPAFAGSIDVVRGAVYLPAKQTTKSPVDGVTAIWSDSTYLAPYTNRVFVIKNAHTTGTISATIEASLDLTTWATIDATATDIAAGTAKTVKVVQNPLPYWRIRAGIANNPTAECGVSMCTN